MPFKDRTYGAYYRASRSEKTRGIPFLLTFEEWLKIWVDSGKLEQRGRRKGEYCMARFGDKGPYAIGNVRIILTTDNSVEGWENDYVPTRKNNMRKKHEMTPEGSAAISNKNKLNPPRLGKKGTKLSAKTKHLMSLAQLERSKREGQNHPLRKGR